MFVVPVFTGLIVAFLVFFVPAVFAMWSGFAGLFLSNSWFMCRIKKSEVTVTDMFIISILTGLLVAFLVLLVPAMLTVWSRFTALFLTGDQNMCRVKRRKVTNVFIVSILTRLLVAFLVLLVPTMLAMWSRFTALFLSDDQTMQRPKRREVTNVLIISILTRLFVTFLVLLIPAVITFRLRLAAVFFMIPAVLTVFLVIISRGSVDR